MSLRDHFTNLMLPVGLIGLPVTLYLVLGTPDSTGFMVSDSEVVQITDQIRVRTREKWLERVKDLDAIVGKIDQIRQEKFDYIKTKGQGQAYLDKFKALAADLHSKNKDYDYKDPNVPLWGLFEAAKNREQKITDYYRDICGAQYAIALQVPASDAIALVKLVQPERITLEKTVLENNAAISGHDKSLELFKKNLINGASSLDAMVDASKKTLVKAREGGEKDDLGKGTFVLEGALAAGSTAGETLRPDELFNSDNGGGDGGFKATPGRVVDKERGLRSDWMFVDKWYVMGPFENRFRNNLDASFLPETVVDLDNVTIGKGDKEIRWEYWLRSKIRIEPTQAPRMCIYYGWTEVFMEQAGKYWVALGSDDYGKMWLNGKQVWSSGTSPKSYRADEFVGEMDFKEGVNQILFRCENAGGTMGWSVTIGTMPNEVAQ